MNLTQENKAGDPQNMHIFYILFCYVFLVREATIISSIIQFDCFRFEMRSKGLSFGMNFVTNI